MYKPPNELVAAVSQPLAAESTGTTSVASKSYCYQASGQFIHVAHISDFDLGFSLMTMSWTSVPI